MHWSTQKSGVERVREGSEEDGRTSFILSGIVSRAAVVASVAADTTVSGVFLLVDRARRQDERRILGGAGEEDQRAE